MNQLLDNIEVKDFISARNKAMLELLYASGMRVSELCELDISQINLKMEYVKVIGKGYKERLIPLNHYVCSIINDYVVNYRNPLLDFQNNNYLFFNKNLKPVSRENFYKILNNIAKDLRLLLIKKRTDNPVLFFIVHLFYLLFLSF